MTVGIATVLQKHITVSLHSPNGRQMPAVRAVQGDRERVYGFDGKSPPTQESPTGETNYARTEGINYYHHW